MLESSSRQILRAVVGFLIVFILIANFFSKKLVEHSIIPLLLCLFYIAVKKVDDFSWRKLFPTTGFDWMFVVWFVILIASHIANGTFGKFEIREVLEYRWFLAVYFFAAAMTFTSIDKKGVILFVSLIAGACGFYLIHFYFNRTQDPTVFGLPNRMIGFLESPTDFGHSVQFLFIFSVVMLAIPFKQKNRTFTVLLWAAAVLSGSNLFLSFTRTSLIAVILSLLVFIVVVYRKFFWRILIAVVSLLVVFYLGNIGGIKDRILFSLHPENTYDENRILLWKYNWALFKDHPLLGVGYHHNFVKYYPQYNSFGIPDRYFSAHAHNQILNLLGGVGIFAALWYVALFVLFGTLAVRNIKKFARDSIQYPLAVTSLLLLLAFFIAGFADTNFELVAPRYYLGFTWALIVYQKHSKNDVAPEVAGG